MIIVQGLIEKLQENRHGSLNIDRTSVVVDQYPRAYGIEANLDNDDNRRIETSATLGSKKKQSTNHHLHEDQRPHPKNGD